MFLCSRDRHAGTPFTPSDEEGTMRARTLRSSPIAVGLAVVLTVAATAAPAAATSAFTNMPLEAYGADASPPLARRPDQPRVAG